MLAVVQTEFRYRGRNISGAEIDRPAVDRRSSRAEPAAAFRKLCQSWNWVQANGQLRHGGPRFDAAVAPGGLIVLPAKRKSVLTTRRGPGSAAGAVLGGRAAANVIWPSWAVGDPASAPHAGGSPLWQIAPNLSLSGVSSPSRGACQISGYGGASRLPAWHGRRTRHLGPRTVSSAGLPRSAGLTSTCWLTTRDFNTALGKSPALGQPFVRPGGAPDLGRLAAALPAPDLFAGNLHRAGPLSRHLLSRGQLASLGLTTAGARTISPTSPTARSRNFGSNLWGGTFANGFAEAMNKSAAPQILA